MKILQEIDVCGAKIGKLNEAGEPQFGICTNAPHTLTRGGFNGHSSPELRAWRAEQTRKSRRKAKESILDDDPDESTCSCNRPGCRYGEMLDSIPTTPAHVVAEREKFKAEEDARREEARLRRIEEERFIAECLDKAAAGQEIEHKELIEICISYLRIHAAVANKFRLDRGSRLRRGFNENGIGERELSSQLYGPESLDDPPALDETFFKVRFGRLLGVQDSRHQIWNRHHQPTTTTSIPVSPRLP